MFNLILFVCMVGHEGCKVYRDTFDNLDQCEAALGEIDNRVPPKGVYYLANCQSVNQGEVL